MIVGVRNPGFREMARKKKMTIWEMRKEWKIRYDGTWREIMNEVSEVVGIPVEDIERINSAWWRYVGEMMCRVEMPRIRMDYFCTLYPSKAKLYSYCEEMGRIIGRLSNGRMKGVDPEKIGDVNVMRKHLERLQDTYFRLCAEKAKPRRKMNEGERARLLAIRGSVEVKMVELRKLKERNMDE